MAAGLNATRCEKEEEEEEEEGMRGGVVGVSPQKVICFLVPVQMTGG